MKKDEPFDLAQGRRGKTLSLSRHGAPDDVEDFKSRHTVTQRGFVIEVNGSLRFAPFHYVESTIGEVR